MIGRLPQRWRRAPTSSSTASVPESLIGSGSATTLAAVNPRLVFTSIKGFGHTGPYSHLKGYEAVAGAKTGSMYGNVAPNRSPDEPVMLVPLGATISAALLALQGTFIALHERERTGFGQRVDATMIQGMMGQDLVAHLDLGARRAVPGCLHADRHADDGPADAGQLAQLRPDERLHEGRPLAAVRPFDVPAVRTRSSGRSVSRSCAASRVERRHRQRRRRQARHLVDDDA